MGWNFQTTHQHTFLRWKKPNKNENTGGHHISSWTIGTRISDGKSWFTWKRAKFLPRFEFSPSFFTLNYLGSNGTCRNFSWWWPLAKISFESMSAFSILIFEVPNVSYFHSTVLHREWMAKPRTRTTASDHTSAIWSLGEGMASSSSSRVWSRFAFGRRYKEVSAQLAYLPVCMLGVSLDIVVMQCLVRQVFPQAVWHFTRRFWCVTGNGLQFFEAQGALPKQIPIPRNSGRMAYANSYWPYDRWAFAVGNASWWSAMLLAPFHSAQRFDVSNGYTPRDGGSSHWLAWLAKTLFEKKGWKRTFVLLCAWNSLQINQFLVEVFSLCFLRCNWLQCVTYVLPAI